jgi:hypothetical protein
MVGLVLGGEGEGELRHLEDGASRKVLSGYRLKGGVKRTA